MASSEDEIKECFRVFDTDNDGKIPVADLGTVIRALGKAPLQAEVEAMENEAGEGLLDYAKFSGFYKRKMRRPAELEREMREAFRALDAQGTGTLTSAELRMLLGALGEPLLSEDVESLLRCVNVDNEGNLKYDELVDLLVGTH